MHGTPYFSGVDVYKPSISLVSLKPLFADCWDVFEATTSGCEPPSSVILHRLQYLHYFGSVAREVAMISFPDDFGALPPAEV